MVDSAIYHGTRAIAPRVFRQPLAIVPRGSFVSFSFDDFPRSARTHGARVLADYGAHGTYYVAMRNLTETPKEHEGFSVEDLRELARQGHEIGCHTHEHLDCFLARDRRILQDVARNAEAVARVLPDVSLRQFAFPFGRLRPSHKTLLGERFESLRTIFPGVHRSVVDLHLLRANKLFSSGPFVSRAADLVDDVAARGGWVIFFAHDVSDTPSPYGIRPAEFARVVALARRRSLEILPVGTVVQRIVREADRAAQRG